MLTPPYLVFGAAAAGLSSVGLIMLLVPLVPGGPGYSTARVVMGIVAIAAGAAFGLLGLPSWCDERGWTTRWWARRHRPYLLQLQRAGFAVQSDRGIELVRQLTAAGASESQLAEWRSLGAVGSVESWDRVRSSGLTIQEARPWSGAGLDARFAAAAKRCHGHLGDVLELVAAFQEGRKNKGLPPADVDELWGTLGAKCEDIVTGESALRREVLGEFLSAPRTQILQLLRAHPERYAERWLEPGQPFLQLQPQP